MNFTIDDAKELTFRESTIKSEPTETFTENIDETHEDEQETPEQKNSRFNFLYLFFPMLMSFLIGVLTGKNLIL